MADDKPSRVDDKPSRIKVQANGSFGIVWFIGWLFTISFASLQWWQALLGLLVWPYYLGMAVR